jgi:hypothetical protein
MNTHLQHANVSKQWIVRLTLLTLFLIFGAFALISPSFAQAAASAGRACIINAPSGVLPGKLIGHVGWAYKAGSGDYWSFGSTEGTGTLTIPAGSDTHSWSNAGTWFGLVGSFENAYYTYYNVKLHDAKYYTQYRCFNVSSSNSSTANAEVQRQATNGYDGFKNNCLTKAIAILKAYGVTNLQAAPSTAPNTYFNNLTGFEAVQPLPPLLQVLVALNDPANGQPINIHPLHTQRQMHLQIYNTSNQLVYNQQTTASQIPGTGKYFSNIVLNSSWTNGSYLVTTKLDYTLGKQVAGIPTISSGQETILPLTSLTMGDIDQNNQLDLRDYNILVSCYGSKQCPTSQKIGSDINDDGTVDGVDLNLWLRIYSTQRGG